MKTEICRIKRRELNSYNKRKDDQGGKSLITGLILKRNFAEERMN